MKRPPNELQITILDLYVLRDGWAQMLAHISSADGHVEDDDTMNPELCLQKLTAIQSAIRDAEKFADSMEAHAAAAPTRAN